MLKNNLDEIAIIGGGPAGVSAAIYSKYIGKTFKLFEKKTIGWVPESHINLTKELQGLPALLHKVNGTQLIEMYRSSLSEMKILPIEHTNISSIKIKKDGFNLITENGTSFHSKTVILTTGTVPKTLGVSNEKKFDNLYNFAYGHADKYKYMDVVVAGSRNSGASAAIYFAERGVKVTMIELKENIQAKDQYLEKIDKLRINVILSSKIIRLIGIPEIKQVEILNVKTNKRYLINCKALFVYIGLNSNNMLAKSLGVSLDNYGSIVVNHKQETNINGVFAAGDVCGGLKHIAAATGQGAAAAYYAGMYLDKTEIQ